MTRSEQIRELFSTLGSTIVSVEFVKRDGTLRKIRFNPKDRQEIVGTGRPSNNPDIFRVRDFDVAKRDGIGAWRSFDANRVRRIAYRGQVLNWTV
jgi:hypothetical protein